MPKTLDELTADLEKLATSTATLTKSLDDEKKARLEAEKIAKMSDAEKAHTKDMTPDQRDAFMAKPTDERVAAMKKRQDDDEVVQIGDTICKKSELGASAFAILKAQAATITRQGEEIRKAAEREVHQGFVKRAQTEFAHIIGTDDEKAETLKAFAALPEAARKKAEEQFKAGNEAMKRQLEEKGLGGAPTFTKAEDELDRLADAHAEKHSVTKAVAYDAVLKTARGKELYSKMEMEKRGRAA